MAAWAGQLDQGLLVVVGEVAVELVDHLERAEQLAAAAAQRHAEQRARLITRASDRPGDRSALLGRDVGVDAPRLGRSAPPGRRCRRRRECAARRLRRPAPGGRRACGCGRSQRKMLARSASSSRVAASAICTSSGSISCVWFHWVAISRIASRRAIRCASRCRWRTSVRACAQAAGERCRNARRARSRRSRCAKAASTFAAAGMCGPAARQTSRRESAGCSRSSASASKSAGNAAAGRTAASVRQLPFVAAGHGQVVGPQRLADQRQGLPQEHGAGRVRLPPDRTASKPTPPARRCDSRLAQSRCRGSGHVAAR